MKEITERMLGEASACRGQIAKFTEIFGASAAEITETNASKAIEAGLDIFFLARFLTAPALAEFERFKAQAWAEYKRVEAQAAAEYKRFTAPAAAEYERVTAQALVAALLAS